MSSRTEFVCSCGTIILALIVVVISLAAGSWWLFGSTVGKVVFTCGLIVPFAAVVAPVVLYWSAKDKEFGQEGFEPRYGIGVAGIAGSTAMLASFLYWVFAISFVFPDSQSWPVRTAILVRESAWMPWETLLALIAGAILILVLLGRLAFQSESIYVQSFGIVAYRLSVYTIPAVLGLASLQLLFCVGVFGWNEIRSMSLDWWIPFRLLAILIALNLAHLQLAMPLQIFRLLQLAGTSLGTTWSVLSPYVTGNGLSATRPDDFLSLSYEFGERSAPCETNIVLLADLHISGSTKGPMNNSRRAGSTRDFIRSSAELGDATILLGDLTDTGSSDDWEQVRQSMLATRTPIIAVPGNHDVHFRGIATNTFGGPQSFDEEEVNAWVQSVSTVDAKGCLAVRLTSGVCVVTLDSNRRESQTAITNALGFVGPAQLGKARLHLEEVRKDGDIVLVALHHHVARPALGIANAFLRCLDADAVLQFAVDVKVDAIVHGHKHMPYVAQYCDKATAHSMLLISCGSAHHAPSGLFRKDVATASAYILGIRHGAIASVELYRDKAFA